VPEIWRLVTAELTKLVSVRASWGLLVGGAGYAAAVTGGVLVSKDRTGLDFGTAEAVEWALHGAGGGATLALVLGIMIAAGEYRHGTMTDTYLTTPRRSRVLLAKLLVAGLAGLVFGALTVVADLAVAIPFYASHDNPLSLGEVDVWGAAVGSVLWSVGFAAIGVALGTLLRNLVLAVVAGLTWVYLLEGVTVNLVPDVGKWLPAGAAEGLGRAPFEDLLPQWGGGLVLAAYTILITGAAILTTMRRDVT
jgi:ABC-2 type transport system permease protein